MLQSLKISSTELWTILYEGYNNSNNSNSNSNSNNNKLRPLIRRHLIHSPARQTLLGFPGLLRLVQCLTLDIASTVTKLEGGQEFVAQIGCTSELHCAGYCPRI